MTNLVAPSATIMINADAPAEAISIVQKQLFINETMSGEDFDLKIEENPNLLQDVKALQIRLLVIQNFTDPSYRDQMDLVLYYANGLISIEKSIFQSPPQSSFPINSAYLSQLLQIKNTQSRPTQSRGNLIC